MYDAYIFNNTILRTGVHIFREKKRKKGLQLSSSKNRDHNNFFYQNMYSFYSISGCPVTEYTEKKKVVNPER